MIDQDGDHWHTVGGRWDIFGPGVGGTWAAVETQVSHLAGQKSASLVVQGVGYREVGRVL